MLPIIHKHVYGRYSFALEGPSLLLYPDKAMSNQLFNRIPEGAPIDAPEFFSFAVGKHEAPGVVDALGILALARYIPSTPMHKEYEHEFGCIAQIYECP